MTSSTKRSILRWTHIIATIPVLGYIYGQPSEVEQYAGAGRFIFVPVLILSGYWMYLGVVFAVIGVAVWLGAVLLSGYGAAVLSQAGLFIARKIYVVVRARRGNHSSLAINGEGSRPG